jgi:hypothetical protein
MKTIICILFVLLSLNNIYGQNLVPNPGFEVINSCAFNPANIAGASPWDTPDTGSPDLYNTCSTNPVFSVRANNFGYQQPRSGSGYAGQVVYNTPSEYKEYIQVKLDSVLIQGQVYFAGYYVNLANEIYTASNNFGIYFSPNHISIAHIATLNLIPQINYTTIISDTLNWVYVHGQYTANGGEQYIIIGNFYSSDLTDTSSTSSTFCTCTYYFVDDVCVSTDAKTCNTTVGIQQTNGNVDVSLFPNPFSTQLTFSVAGNEQTTVSLYDCLGQQILQQTFTNSTTVNTEQLAVGIYFYELSRNKGTLKTGKLVKQ